MTTAPSHGEPGTLLGELTAAVGAAHVSQRAIDRYALAHDASHYRLVPHTVLRPRALTDVARILAICDRQRTPLTFRSAGTSLSGQAVTNHILVETRRDFRAVEVLDGGRRVRVQPGAGVGTVNAHLARFGRRLGPDPASESACTVGGVIANNSSGMQCGTTQNTYATIDTLVFVLPNGTIIDSGAADAAARFARSEPRLHDGLLRLRDRLRDNPAWVSTLRRQFSIKNTMGYGLNAFLDHDDPLDILVHLIVGSEGTLAFVAEATFHTVEVLPHKATGLLLFENLDAAIESVTTITETGAAAVELLDPSSLAVTRHDESAPAELRALPVGDRAGLLVEYQAGTIDELRELSVTATSVLSRLPLTAPPRMTQDDLSRARLWRVRKGLYSAVAWARPPGTNALLEDFSVPPHRLGPTCRELTSLFRRHGYDGSVLFGHAKDGNLHFLLNERFDDAAHMRRYEAFTDEFVSLVLAEGGSLKAEHGTGRVMAPYVRRQYGDELFTVMRQLKQLVDPHEIMNPGVLIETDPQAHTRNLKTAPHIDPEVDRCVECGYCEPVCPSRDLTLTPRQRIVARREIAAAREAGDEQLAQELLRDYEYDGVQTCAVDGMCAHACPVRINTGDLVRRLRAEAESKTSGRAWRAAAGHWSTATRLGSAALTAAAHLPAPIAAAGARAARRIIGPEHVPLYGPGIPSGGHRRPRLDSDNPDAVLFAGCIGGIFGPEPGHPGATNALITLCERAGVALRTPANLNDLCCATPWKSKGHTDGLALMSAKVLPALRQATEDGRLPVVVDAGSCASGLLTMITSNPGAERLRVMDATTFAADELVDRLRVRRRVPSLALHPTCAAETLGSRDAMARIAREIADEVVIPIDWGCCGFAGDRGMLHPELTAAATAPEAAEVTSRSFTAYASDNRTCELAMTRATGKPYVSIVELLADATATN